MTDDQQQLSGPEFASLQHWSEYGQMGEPSNHKVLASEWNAKPFRQPITSSWNIAIPADQLDRLLKGFCPGAMEDKWFIYADDPDADGHTSLHMFRSWTGNKMAEIDIETLVAPAAAAAAAVNGGDTTTGGRMVRITWESSEDAIRGNSEERAKKSAVEVCKWVLGVNLPEGGNLEEERQV